MMINKCSFVLHKYYFWGTIAVLSLIDYLLTIRYLSQPGVGVHGEMNAILAYLISKFGTYHAILAFKTITLTVFLFALVFWKKSSTLISILMILMAASMLSAVAWGVVVNMPGCTLC